MFRSAGARTGGGFKITGKSFATAEIVTARPPTNEKPVAPVTNANPVKKNTRAKRPPTPKNATRGFQERVKVTAVQGSISESHPLTCELGSGEFQATLLITALSFAHTKSSSSSAPTSSSGAAQTTVVTVNTPPTDSSAGAIVIAAYSSLCDGPQVSGKISVPVRCSKASRTGGPSTTTTVTVTGPGVVSFFGIRKSVSLVRTGDGDDEEVPDLFACDEVEEEPMEDKAGRGARNDEVDYKDGLALFDSASSDDEERSLGADDMYAQGIVFR